MPSVSLLMGILFSRHPSRGQPGTVAISSRGYASIFIKAAACLVLLALLWNLFKERNLSYRAFRKTESGCKGNNFLAYLPNFPETFFKAFRPSGEPTGSSPKAGAKVVGSHVTAKHIQDFFYRKMKVFCSTAGIQRVTDEDFQKRKGRGKQIYTIV